MLQLLLGRYKARNPAMKMASGKIQRPFILKDVEADPWSVAGNATSQNLITLPNIDGYIPKAIVDYDNNTGTAQNNLICYTKSIIKSGSNYIAYMGYKNTGSAEASVTSKLIVMYVPN